MTNAHLLGREPVTIPDADPHDGPHPHEDLTIAEQIETMRLSDEHRPGEQCFLTEHGERRWVSESDVEHFIRTYGALHPSNFLVTQGGDWREDFFGDR